MEPHPRGIPLQRYRTAIEDYTSAIDLGKTIPLDSRSRMPFATYLVAMHNRVHPIFSDHFLTSLDSLPSSHPLNTPTLWMIMEIVLAGDSGQVTRLGVLRTSGVTAFDIAALDSVMRAAPYGVAPAEIRSADGLVYMQWEFHRNPVAACSTLNVRPYLLHR